MEIATEELDSGSDFVSLGPEALDDELTSGAEILVVDVRPREAFESWRIDIDDGRLINCPISELEGSLAMLREAREGRPLRVICAAGISSVEATRRIQEAGLPASNVEGGMIAWSRLLKKDEVPGSGPETTIQFRREARGCLSYLIASGGEALVVDPAPNVRPYLAEAERLGARLVAVFDTHIHADHVSGASELAAMPGVTYYLGRRSLERGFQAQGAHFRLVDSGSEIEVGEVRPEVVGLPGHTTEMSGLLLSGNLFCGDSIFSDGVARPDLQDASPEVAREAARLLHQTIKQTILPLPPATTILTCHYPGGRLEEPIAPRLSEVVEAVPELSLAEDEFIDWVVADLPSKPSNFERIIESNLGLSKESKVDLGRLETGANSCASR